MEHALVGRGLGALEIIVRRIDNDENVPRVAVEKLLDFFQVFGDTYHLAKEERVFIPSLEDGCGSGSRCDVGSAVGEAYHKHEEARMLLRSLQNSAQRLNEEGARKVFVRSALDYMALMREQIAKEKDSLIRTAAVTLFDKDGRLARSFRRYAEREMILKTSQQFASDIDAILLELSVMVPPARSRAYSRGTIPYHKGPNHQVRF